VVMFFPGHYTQEQASVPNSGCLFIADAPAYPPIIGLSTSRTIASDFMQIQQLFAKPVDRPSKGNQRQMTAPSSHRAGE